MASEPISQPARIDTSLVRSFAIVAIVNSHMESYYPRPEAAIGGLVGLALFFMATGMGINASRSTRELSFAKWYWLRILRIQPSVIVSAVLVQLLLLGGWRNWTTLDYVGNLFYPLLNYMNEIVVIADSHRITTYHFLEKIFIFYVPLYFYVRWHWKHKHLFGITACILLCIATSVPDIQKELASSTPLKTGFLNPQFLWSVFFFMMLLGVWISDSPWLFRERSHWLIGSLVALLGVLYLGTKYAMAKEGVFTEGFLLLFAFGISLSVMLVVFLSDERRLRFCRDRNRLLNWATIGVGTISLEIYLVHTQFYMHRAGLDFSFPISFVIFAVYSLIGSLLVFWLASKVRTMLGRD